MKFPFILKLEDKHAGARFFGLGPDECADIENFIFVVGDLVRDWTGAESIVCWYFDVDTGKWSVGCFNSSILK